MGVLSFLRTGTGLTEATVDPRVAQHVDALAGQLRGEQDTNLHLVEALADAELALEDRGWQALTAQVDTEFSREGLRTACRVARAMAVTNPLIRRGIALRIGYVWGSGVEITARDADVNAVIQDFLDDEGNRAAFTGEQAHEENERALGTDGNVFVALFTKPATGRVQARTIVFDEIADVITNPDDRDDPWYYLRSWTTTELVPGAGGVTSRTVQRQEYYPALGYRPRVRPRALDGKPIHWDCPVLHVSVNRLDGWKFGVGDVYTALPWARAYREFLADWAQLVKALSRFAWRQTSRGRSTAQRAAAQLRQALPPATAEGQSNAGATVAMTADATLEAIPKTGATIDSESGRPLAAMIAAGLEIPVTSLLSDPGQTGARAVAETLNQPTRLVMNMRRTRWAEAHRRVLGYVVAEAVRAPRGPLAGSVIRDEHDREVVTLAQDAPTTVEVSFPSLDEVDPNQLISSIKTADDTRKLPPLTIARLLLQALGVKDVDEVLEELTDADGNFIDPEITAGLAAMRRHDRGED